MFGRRSPPPPTAQDALSEHVAHTVQTVASLRSRAQDRVSRQQRAVELFTATLGRPRTLGAISCLVTRRDLPTVRDRVDTKANAMARSVDAGAVLAALEQTLEAPSDEREATLRKPDAPIDDVSR